MKKAPIDIQQVMFTRYASSKQFLSRFREYWPTTTIDGVEVFTPTLEIWPHRTEKTTRLLKMLNILKQVEGMDTKGIEKVFLKFNPDKADNHVPDFSEVRSTIHNTFLQILHNYNKDRESINTTNYIPARVVIQNFNKSDFNVNHVNVVLQDYTVVSNASPILPFALLSKSGVRITRVYTTRKRVTYYNEDDDKSYVKHSYVISTCVEFDITPSQLDINSIATFIHDNYNSTTSAAIFNIHPLFSLSSSSYFIYDGINSSTLITYPALKVSVTDAINIDLHDAVILISASITTGYEEEEADFWTRLAVGIITIVAIVLAIPSGGTSLSLLAVCTIIITVSVVMAITAYALQQTGHYADARFVSRYNQQLAPYVQIASIIILISTGVDYYSAYSAANAATATTTSTTASTTVANTTVTSTAVAEDLVTNTVSISLDAATNAIKDYVVKTISNITVSDGLKLLNYVTNLYYSNKLADIHKDINKYKDALAKARATKEGAEQNDLAKEFLLSIGKDLTADWSKYAAIYDKPYDPTHPRLHTGNIQATEVDAFLFADYT